MKSHRQVESLDLLFAEGREHDLPPKWDGIVVEWAGWRLVWSTLVWHIKPRPCSQCKSTRPQETAYGYRDNIPGVLVAFRCPDCLHDVVVDPHTDEWWDLDDSDYGPEGSTAVDE